MFAPNEAVARGSPALTSFLTQPVRVCYLIRAPPPWCQTPSWSEVAEGNYCVTVTRRWERLLQVSFGELQLELPLILSKRIFWSCLWSLAVGKDELPTGSSASIRSEGDLEDADVYVQMWSNSWLAERMLRGLLGEQSSHIPLSVKAEFSLGWALDPAPGTGES